MKRWPAFSIVLVFCLAVLFGTFCYPVAEGAPNDVSLPQRLFAIAGRNHHISTYTSGQEIRFVGRAVGSLPAISASGWIVQVEQIVSGPSISDEVSVWVYVCCDCSGGYADPDIDEGDTVEVYGMYYSEPFAGYPDQVRTCESEDYYIRVHQEQECMTHKFRGEVIRRTDAMEPIEYGFVIRVTEVLTESSDFDIDIGDGVIVWAEGDAISSPFPWGDIVEVLGHSGMVSCIPYDPGCDTAGIRVEVACDEHLNRVDVSTDEEERPGGWQVSNVDLSGHGNHIQVNPGEEIRISFDYRLWNPDNCRACIQQIVVGVGNDAKYCAYNDVPGTYPGESRSGSHTIVSPRSPGIYSLITANDYQYNCSDAMSRYPQQGEKTAIATIRVAAEEESTPEVDFRVDRNNIEPGECTTLRWSVEHVEAVYLDGHGVIGHDSRQVCPGQTTTYTLYAVTAIGSVDKTVTVTVEPIDTIAVAIVDVGIQHPFMGDLEIWIGVEGGHEAKIWSREGGSSENIYREWDLGELDFTEKDLPPSDSKRWYLKVRDNAGGDEGRIEHFQITYGGKVYSSPDSPRIRDHDECVTWIPPLRDTQSPLLEFVEELRNGGEFRVIVGGPAEVRQGNSNRYVVDLIVEPDRDFLEGEYLRFSGGTMLIAYDRRKGPDVLIDSHYRKRTKGGWQEIDILKEVQEEDILNELLSFLWDVTPVSKFVEAFRLTLKNWLGISLDPDLLPPEEWLDNNHYVTKTIPITSGGVLSGWSGARTYWEMDFPYIGEQTVRIWGWTRVEDNRIRSNRYSTGPLQYKIVFQGTFRIKAK